MVVGRVYCSLVVLSNQLVSRLSLNYVDLFYVVLFLRVFFFFLHAYHFMRNGEPSLFVIMKCDFVLPALCLLNRSAKLPSPHQEISELRFVFLSFFEVFFVGVVYETVSIAAFFSCYSKLFIFGTVFS